MKTASVTDLTNNFAAILKWTQAGKVVTITKRGRTIATFAPAGE